MTMDDAEYDAVAAAITKALLEQEIKELLEEHEKMDDTDDNDALLLAIITLGLVCIVVVATCCCCGLLYCLVKCIRKRRNKKPQNIIIINEEERKKRCLVFLCGNAYLEDVPRNFLPLFTFSRSRRMLLNNVNMYVSKGNLMQKS